MMERLQRGERRWCAAVAALALALAVAVALGPLEGVPHVSDEVAYTLQSRLFAAGVRTGPAADEASMVLYPFWQAGPRSYAVFPFGWPALLAPFEAAGLPWLANALAGAVLSIVAYLLGRCVGGVGVARTASVLVAVSPAFWMLTASRMAHASVAAALGVALVLTLRPTRGWTTWLLVGGCVGYVVLARPFDAAVLGGPLLVFGLWRCRGVARMALVAAPLAAVALVGWDNLTLTGSATTFPVGPWFEAWADRPGCNGLGFGEHLGCHATLGSLGHSPEKALRFAWQGVRLLDAHLLGVPGGLAVAAAGWIVAGRRALWMPAVFAVTVAAYSTYWSPGHVYGARYYMPVFVLAAVGAASLLHRVAKRWAVAVPPLVASLAASPILSDLSSGPSCVDGSVVHGLAERGITRGLVFVHGEGTRPDAWPALGIDAFLCDPMLASGSGFAAWDPAGGGVEIRHALLEAEQRAAFRDAFHPGADTWFVAHDVVADSRRWFRVDEDGRLIAE